MSGSVENNASSCNQKDLGHLVLPENLAALPASPTAKADQPAQASSGYTKGPVLSLDSQVNAPLFSSFWSHGEKATFRKALEAAGHGDALSKAYLKSFISQDLDKFVGATSSLTPKTAGITQEDLVGLILQFHHGAKYGDEKEQKAAADALVHYVIKHTELTDSEHDLALGVLLFLETLSESDHTDALYDLVAHLKPEEAQLLDCLCKDAASPKLLKAIHQAEKTGHQNKKAQQVQQEVKTENFEVASAPVAAAAPMSAPVQELTEKPVATELTKAPSAAPVVSSAEAEVEVTQANTPVVKLPAAEAIEKSLVALSTSPLAQFVDMPSLQVRLEKLFSETAGKGAVTTANTIYIATLAAGNKDPQVTNVGERYAPLRSYAAEIARSIVEKTGLATPGQALDLPETEAPIQPALVSGKKLNPTEIRNAVLAAQVPNIPVPNETVAAGTIAPNSSSAAAGMMAALAGQWRFGSNTLATQDGFGGSSRPSYFIDATGSSPQSHDGQGQGGQDNSEEETPERQQAQAFAWA